MFISVLSENKVGNYNTAESAINTVKISTYKSQLEQKKQELQELEESNTNAFVKFFKALFI